MVCRLFEGTTVPIAEYSNKGTSFFIKTTARSETQEFNHSLLPYGPIGMDNFCKNQTHRVRSLIQETNVRK